jgi:hypothetical protein
MRYAAGHRREDSNGFYRTLLIKNIGYQLSQDLNLLNVRHFTLVAVFVAMTKHK